MLPQPAQPLADLYVHLRKVRKLLITLSDEMKTMSALIDEIASTSLIEPKDSGASVTPNDASQSALAAAEAIATLAQSVRPRRVRRRFTTLAESYPEVAKMWNTEKNGGLTPDQVSKSSAKKYWWKCPSCENEWQASVLSQVMRKYPCAFCSKPERHSSANLEGAVVARPGTETLASACPNVAKEWHPELNGGITPDKVSAKSHHRAWWICSHCQHTYRARIVNRTIGSRCPKCNHLTVG
jgi:DNA-directed RNA polymerase subunit RPC12/RpoP